LLDRFWSVTGFRYESYVRFTRKDCGDPFAQYRMKRDPYAPVIANTQTKLVRIVRDSTSM
jgi:hypothetical protein